MATVEGPADPLPSRDAPADSAMTPTRLETSLRSHYELVGLVVACVVVVALVTALWPFPLRREQPVATPRSLAVLPFTNVGGDPDQEYLADGLTDEVVADLAKIPGLRLISRTSVMRYKGLRKPAPEIGRELGVAALVEGSVSVRGSHALVTTQLIDAATDRHLWSGRAERPLAELVQLEREVALNAMRAVGAELPVAEAERLERGRVVDAAAYRAYLRGRYEYEKATFEGGRAAMRRYAEALAIDPTFAKAHAGIADAYGLAHAWGLPIEERAEGARAAALRALALDPYSAEALNALGRLKMRYDWDWAGAERDLRRAIELAPNYTDAHINLAALLGLTGRFEPALDEAERAQELDPLNPAAFGAAAKIYFWSRRYDRAIAEAQRALAIDPGYLLGHYLLGSAYLHAGRFEEALRELERGIAESGDRSDITLLGYAQALAGHTDEARKLMAEVEELVRHDAHDNLTMAYLHAALNEKDAAFHRLERAVNERHPQVSLAKVDPFLDPLRSDPRFAALARRIGLTP